MELGYEPDNPTCSMFVLRYEYTEMKRPFTYTLNSICELSKFTLIRYTSNPQLSPSMSFLRVHVLSLLNYHIN